VWGGDFGDTDTLAIDLADGPGANTGEIADGVTVAYDADGQLIGIEIEQAATRLDLSTLVLTGFPGETHRRSA
jgi:uncharacterized protein YuzE